MGVDVLAVMDRAIGGMPYLIDDELEIARAEVAELIDAGHALQAAMGDDDSNTFDISPAQRFFAADARHRAALAKVTGASDGR